MAIPISLSPLPAMITPMASRHLESFNGKGKKLFEKYRLTQLLISPAL